MNRPSMVEYRASGFLPTGPFISFPLSNGNRFRMDLDKPITPAEFERIKSLLELSRDSIVADRPRPDLAAICDSMAIDEIAARIATEMLTHEGGRAVALALKLPSGMIVGGWDRDDVADRVAAIMRDELGDRTRGDSGASESP